MVGFERVGVACFCSVEDWFSHGGSTLGVISNVPVHGPLSYLYSFPNHSSCPMFDVGYDVGNGETDGLRRCSQLFNHFFLLRFDVLFPGLTGVSLNALWDFVNFSVVQVDLRFCVGLKYC